MVKNRTTVYIKRQYISIYIYQVSLLIVLKGYTEKLCHHKGNFHITPFIYAHTECPPQNKQHAEYIRKKSVILSSLYME